MRSPTEIMRDWDAWRKEHPLPREVYFDKQKFGKVTNEVAVPEDAGEFGDYVKLIQRVQAESPREPWIRFTYYRKVNSRSPWRLAGQTSLILPLEDARELLKKAQDRGLLAD